MTSAARPTFLPAVGGHSLRDTGAGPVTYVSAKDLKAHTKLKFRKEKDKNQEDDHILLKQKLYEKEQEYLQKVTAKQTLTLQIPNELKMLDQDQDSSEFTEESESESESDSEELMRELEKIKQERIEEKKKIEFLKKEQERKEIEERAISGNPLLNEEFAQEIKPFSLKRRWDDDVIFKNQSRQDDIESKSKKRFINDMLRSDFHRKFMNKYMK